MSAPRLSFHPMRLCGYLGTAVAALVVGCTTTAPPAPPKPTETTEPMRPTPPPVATNATPESVSSARTPRDYRRDAAAHLYAKNTARIYAGKMPPLLHAIGVLQVDINARGAVTGLHWMRAPKHAPDVVAEIERAVHQAAPFPAPVKLGRVTYTDTWLWDKSGRFQLDTLTEGQL